MNKVSIIYWSGTGNTETMANLIAEGAKNGGAEVEVKAVSSADVSDIESADVIALGCPSMGDEILEESEMEPFIESIESAVKGKKIALFGSYGWGDGKWMRDWEERMTGYGAVVINDGLIANYAPDSDKEKECLELGEDLAK
ncbi:MAG: flavodoxin [Clostridium argentinense]|uniref:Flavodoxin n=1 Tax=Clostridium faecium TaxID=2762223 RepID=A0ABR8YVP8_9CLOT|nr:MULTISPECIES: flavodoxin [Clostridium]MBD8048310.1 flavodoxin [Clostridium faecium]MBS5825241.1 flavodoxin [Clostridium argentinense]MDU1350207.1 flavodoxin [Clostridium argentinense]